MGGLCWGVRGMVGPFSSRVLGELHNCWAGSADPEMWIFFMDL